jgi:hypothetical protein
MKRNKFKHEEITAGLLVAVNTCDDGNIYAVLTPHEEDEFLFLLVQEQNGKVVHCGWLDYSYFYKPTKNQLAFSENQWVKKYRQTEEA